MRLHRLVALILHILECFRGSTKPAEQKKDRGERE